ncbi:condensation domain-containing protein [Aliagarivorans marinus]|uniref:condensation domain-containing protein n=1 Tax=Aliagarivorans marinus TaxID=561965 RepID=UPI00041F238B|nr:condensation domain-containing protein [Aliagarivorans marinus]
MTKLYRHLEAYEYIFAEGSALGSMTVVNLAFLKGELDQHALACAVERLQKQFQPLNVGIAKHAENWHFTQSQQAVAISVEPAPDPSRLKSVAFQAMEEECEARFDLTGPLWRIRVILGKDQHALFLSAHHSICDGISVQLLLDRLVAELNCPSEAQEQTPIPPSGSDCVAHQQTDLSQTPFTSGNEPEDMSAWVDTSQAMTLRNRTAWLDVEADKLKSLLQQCRQHGVTLNSLLFAVIANALATIAERPVSHVECSGNVNTRPYCQPEIANEALGVFASSFSIDVACDGNPWQMAKRCGDDFATIIDSRVFLNTAKHQWYLNMADSHTPPPLGRYTCAHLSNLGRLAFSQCDPVLPLHITDSYFTSGQQQSGSVFWVGAATVGSRLNLVINCVQPLVSERMRLAFIEQLRNGLLKLV